MVFKIVGSAAGALLEDSHSQLIVTPIVPINVWEEMTGSMEFFNYRGRCIYCDMIHLELQSEKRIVLDTPNFVAFCPYAARFPFETWILPKMHNSHFENIQRNEVDELGTVLKTILLKLEAALDKPAYNYIIHTSPFDTGLLPHYHWHLEVIPRLTRVAGFEWGTGFYINPVPPEQSAQFLAQTEVDLTTPRCEERNVHKMQSRRALALIAAAVLAPAVCADDWPQWMGPERDGVWRETGLLDRFPRGGPRERWHMPVGGGYAGPAVADG